MQIESNGHTYTWHDHWAKIPDTPAGRNSGRTHGVAVVPDGRVAVFNQNVPGVIFFDPSGKLVDSWGDRFTGAHGLTLNIEDGQPVFWLVDQNSCEVCKTTIDGKLLQRLEPPPVEERFDGRFMSTWADTNPANGDIWVADGYGGSGVFRYDASGKYMGKLSGEEGAGRFACPHALRFGPDGNLYIADRGNQRITVYDGDGNHIKNKDDACHSPCMLDFHDGKILVPELSTGAKVLDMDLNVLADLGANPAINGDTKPEGWPNLAGTEHVKPGFFNSPHGGCFAPNGDIYIVEWIVGGRITKLEKN